ncbi:RNA-binding protein [Agriterribacter sp.]|uniref:RNA recognition motif domain-containing protein n=1 Tax=Agriterribacter sp. TaxID=2821509 RepID=UPI002D1FBC90|nr:RNA-binding protein [Agriterribacter sp.]
MYVSNLSFHTTDEDLKNLFSDFGEVSSSKVITDRETGRSRGFGFVEMPEDADAKKAMEELDGKDIEGRALSVTVARPKEQRSGGSSFSQNRKRW